MSEQTALKFTDTLIKTTKIYTESILTQSKTARNSSWHHFTTQPYYVIIS